MVAETTKSVAVDKVGRNVAKNELKQWDEGGWS